DQYTQLFKTFTDKKIGREGMVISAVEAYLSTIAKGSGQDRRGTVATTPRALQDEGSKWGVDVTIVPNTGSRPATDMADLLAHHLIIQAGDNRKWQRPTEVHFYGGEYLSPFQALQISNNFAAQGVPVVFIMTSSVDPDTLSSMRGMTAFGTINPYKADPLAAALGSDNFLGVTGGSQGRTFTSSSESGVSTPGKSETKGTSDGESKGMIFTRKEQNKNKSVTEAEPTETKSDSHSTAVSNEITTGYRDAQVANPTIARTVPEFQLYFPGKTAQAKIVMVNVGPSSFARRDPDTVPVILVEPSHVTAARQLRDKRRHAIGPGPSPRPESTAGRPRWPRRRRD
ncbi:MAG TPA: hypothetical protein VNZ86_18140, partial [Bacteroidia bacterium]|nr:hypothetical protein [Bacteroidia bacterium]